MLIKSGISPGIVYSAEGEATERTEGIGAGDRESKGC